MLFSHPNPEIDKDLKALRRMFSDMTKDFFAGNKLTTTPMPPNALAIVDADGCVVPIQLIFHHDPEDGFEMLLLTEDKVFKAGLLRWCKDPELFYVDERFTSSTPVLRCVFGPNLHHASCEAHNSAVMALTYCLDEQRKRAELEALKEATI